MFSERGASPAAPMSVMFRKILVANRGEIALRIIRSCREMGIGTVSVYSTADRDSLHVGLADEAVCIGPHASKDSYLHIPSLISAAELTNATAIHPGYGFLAENDEFSRVCHEHGIKFIGPSAEMIATMGDKARAKETMKKAGLLTIPGSDGVITSLPEAKRAAQAIGYPVLLKATAGGGGKGIRLVRDKRDFEKVWEAAKIEALNAFGNGDLYIEKFVEEPRHIEIQLIGDQGGRVCHLSERDCSIQRRHQKLLEESPSPFFAKHPHLREKMGEAAIRGAAAIAYEGCGTMEFLVDKHGAFYFMEMNTRIQVEHPVTEEVTGVDLIEKQILMAMGVSLSAENYYPTGHAIECRINAEDPAKNFQPSPGEIVHLHMPGGHGVRVDTHIYTGYVIPPFYDSMIAKLIVRADSREKAIEKMRRALHEFIIEGVSHTIPLHLLFMADENFKKGHFTTSFMEHFSRSSLSKEATS